MKESFKTKYENLRKDVTEYYEAHKARKTTTHSVTAQTIGDKPVMVSVAELYVVAETAALLGKNTHLSVDNSDPKNKKLVITFVDRMAGIPMSFYVS